MQSRGQNPARRQQGVRVHGAPGSAQGQPRQGDAPAPQDGAGAPSPRWSSFESLAQAFARIKVIGVGGAGGNAINRMVRSGVDGIEFVAVNTDAQALMTSEATIAIRIGDKLTKGLGAGGRPEIGERAAEESSESLTEVMKDCDMIFIAAGMGGGTGTGASPTIARLAKAAGALTVAVVTKPFEFEGGRRRRAAEEGIALLRETVDALITIPNERLLHMVDPKTTVTEAFQIADDVLRQGIAGISDLITKPGVINLDFADVKTIMHDAGSALMAIGYGEGSDRCVNAAREAIESPLLEMNIQGAKGVLYNISGGGNLTLFETSEAADVIRAAADDDAEIIYGTSIDEALGDGVMITLIATGFDEHDQLDNYGIRNLGRDDARMIDRAPQRSAGNQPVQARPAANEPPVYPDDDWETESSIIRFLRER
ncbi:MAG: Cell division protein FtsZ [uncultured Thermomicrobiales bacterium]|uniref:Cell division protein FtsZ n=1 Tax=uncultured Thermomicrobiales bacterium TaxID=1645740 RepID=A0A6J4UII5_9BACT|nr:MAG: Cell division protein FtsZ [uncultured Thermomicrobiales bacterium]